MAQEKTTVIKQIIQPAEDSLQWLFQQFDNSPLARLFAGVGEGAIAATGAAMALFDRDKSAGDTMVADTAPAPDELRPGAAKMQAAIVEPVVPLSAFLGAAGENISNTITTVAQRSYGWSQDLKMQLQDMSEDFGSRTQYLATRDLPNAQPTLPTLVAGQGRAAGPGAMGA